MFDRSPTPDAEPGFGVQTSPDRQAEHRTLLMAGNSHRGNAAMLQT